jgi:hypothetical protein
MRALAALLLVAAPIGCTPSSDAPADAAPPTSAAPTASAPAPAPPTASAPPAPREPLELQKFRFAGGIKGKEPTEELKSTEPGKRVWAHLTLRNRSKEVRSIKVVFRVNGEKRTAVDLDVQPSWSFRTWAYVTLRDGDTGDVTVDVTDDTAATLVSEKLPIRAAKKK